MRPHELTGERQRAAAVFQSCIPDRPCVDHVRPDFEASPRPRPSRRPPPAVWRPPAASPPTRPGSGAAENRKDPQITARSADPCDRAGTAHRLPRARRGKPGGSAGRSHPWCRAWRPDIVRSVQGETSQAQPGNCSPSARNRPISPSVRLPPALSPPTAIASCWYALLAQEAPSCERVLMGGRVGVLGRAPVIDRERTRFAPRGLLPSPCGDGSGSNRSNSRRRGNTAARGMGRCRVRSPPTRRATPSQSTASHFTSEAIGQVDPTSSKRWRRSDHPTGRGFEPSNARMASISLCAKVLSPDGGIHHRNIDRAAQKF